ncbi:MAG TPA: hypothetical protein VNR18_09530 [Hyphomicrobiales bacterium]|nr:hypothetical protein [Hyphomicrobiales bacterium]
MNCTQCREILSSGHPEERASPDTCSTLQAHLAQCPACTHEAAQLEQLFALLDYQEQPSPALAAGFAVRLGQAGTASPGTAYTAVPLEQTTAPRPGPAPIKSAAPFSGLFRMLWPTRPLGAFSYSTALLCVGLLGGQLLPPGALGVHTPNANQEPAATNGILICPVQYSPPALPYSSPKLLS